MNHISSNNLLVNRVFGQRLVSSRIKIPLFITFNNDFNHFGEYCSTY